jgi:hypothetical protein
MALAIARRGFRNQALVCGLTRNGEHHPSRDQHQKRD